MHGATDKKRVLIAACLTAGFMVAEALGGLFTGSLALLADAGVAAIITRPNSAAAVPSIVVFIILGSPLPVMILGFPCPRIA